MRGSIAIRGALRRGLACGLIAAGLAALGLAIARGHEAADQGRAMGAEQLDFRAQAQRRLAALSLDQQVGQIFFIGFDPAAGDGPGIERLIREQSFGNVILFKRNLSDPLQAAQQANRLQSWAREALGVPLLIGVDQEGGRINRIERGVTVMPSALYLGLYCSPEQVREVGRIAGVELRAMGFNVSFAPVCDVDSNPRNPIIHALRRSFSSNPEEAALLARAYLEGLQQAGVLGVAKHFPGHGDTDVDSHVGLPIVNASLDLLRKRELVPFRRLIEGGGLRMVMTAHVQYAALATAEYEPATLSRPIVSGLLREELGFDGVVVCDDLEMGAVTGRLGAGETALAALEAGCDMLVFCRAPQWQIEAREAVLSALRTGRLPAERVRASALRVLELKQRQGLFGDWGMVDPLATGRLVGTPQHRAFRESLDNLPRKPNHPDSGWNPLPAGG